MRDTVHGTAHFRLAMVSGKRKRLALKALIVISCGCIGVIPFEWMLKQDAQCSRIANFANYLFAIATAFMAAGVVRPRASAARARVRARAQSSVATGPAVVTDRKLPMSVLFGLVLCGCALPFSMRSDISTGASPPF